MSDRDEQIALGDLVASPPDKVLYQNVAPAAYLRLFPSSDPARLRMRRIEDWLRENYQPDPAFAHAHPGYDLLTPRLQKLAGGTGHRALWPVGMAPPAELPEDRSMVAAR